MIQFGYDPEAYEEQFFTPILNFFEAQGISAGTVIVGRRALDVPSLIEITLPSIIAISFLKGFFTEAGKDAWKAFKNVLIGTKKHDVPELDVRIDLQSLQIVTGVRVNIEITAEKFLKKLVTIQSDIDEMAKVTPEGLNYVYLTYNEQKDIFEAKGMLLEEGTILDMHFDFGTKSWKQIKDNT